MKKQLNVRIEETVIKEMDDYRLQTLRPYEQKEIFVEKAVKLRLNLLKGLKK